MLDLVIGDVTFGFNVIAVIDDDLALEDGVENAVFVFNVDV